MIRWQDLIATSRLLTSTPGPNIAPLPDSLRRAVSTVYYAVFHALANSNADCLIGVPTSSLLEHTWQRARRALEHILARRNLGQDRHRFSPPVQKFITTFAAFQNARHTADYDASREFTLTETQSWTNRAEEAITDCMSIGEDERRAIAVQALIRGVAPDPELPRRCHHDYGNCSHSRMSGVAPPEAVFSGNQSLDLETAMSVPNWAGQLDHR